MPISANQEDNICVRNFWTQKNGCIEKFQSSALEKLLKGFKLRDKVFVTEPSVQNESITISLRKHELDPLQSKSFAFTAEKLQSFIESRQKRLLSTQLLLLNGFQYNNQNYNVDFKKVLDIHADMINYPKAWFDHILDVQGERNRAIFNSELVIHVLNALISIKSKKGQFLYVVRQILPLLNQVIIRAKEIVGVYDEFGEDETTYNDDPSPSILTNLEVNSVQSQENIINFEHNQKICLISVFGAYMNISIIYAAVGHRYAAVNSYRSAFVSVRSTNLLQRRRGEVPNELSPDVEVWRWLRKRKFVVIHPCKEIAHMFGVY